MKKTSITITPKYFKYGFYGVGTSLFVSILYVLLNPVNIAPISSLKMIFSSVLVLIVFSPFWIAGAVIITAILSLFDSNKDSQDRVKVIASNIAVALIVSANLLTVSSVFFIIYALLIY